MPSQPDMTAPEPLQPTPAEQPRLQNFWGRLLLPLLLSFVSLILGWHLSESGHSRLASASQTTPALPELRPSSSPQPTLQGVGTLPDPLRAAPLSHWTAEVPVAHWPERPAGTDLLALGRMNLDGG